MNASAATAEERLRRIARGDLAGLGVLAGMHEGVREASGLDAQTFELVRIAALAAVDGSAVSWVLHLDVADEANLDVTQLLGTLVAIAPIVGTPRVVSAGAKMLRAVGLAEAVASDR